MITENMEVSQGESWNPTLRQIAYEWGLPIKPTTSRKRYRKRFRQSRRLFDKEIANAFNETLPLS